MPNKTIYVTDTDLPLFERAQELAGGNLSAAIAQALRRYVTEGTDESGAVTIKVGAGGAYTKKRFRGHQVGKQLTRGSQGTRMLLYRVYQTEKGRLAVHITDSPNWTGKHWAHWASSGESWGGEEFDWHPTYRFAVYDTLEELRGNIPEELFTVVHQTVMSGSDAEELDI